MSDLRIPESTMAPMSSAEAIELDLLGKVARLERELAEAIKERDWYMRRLNYALGQPIHERQDACENNFGKETT